MIETVRSRPSRTTVTCAGVAALQPSTCAPAQRCVATWRLQRLGSAALAVDGDDAVADAAARSPPRRPEASASTRLVAVWTGVPQISKYAMSSTSASTMLTAGPAPITTIRFHTGWR